MYNPYGPIFELASILCTHLVDDRYSPQPFFTYLPQPGDDGNYTLGDFAAKHLYVGHFTTNGLAEFIVNLPEVASSIDWHTSLDKPVVFTQAISDQCAMFVGYRIPLNLT